MSWKDKDWDSLTFYNNDGETLKKAKEVFTTSYYSIFCE